MADGDTTPKVEEGPGPERMSRRRLLSATAPSMGVGGFLAAYSSGPDRQLRPSFGGRQSSSRNARPAAGIP